MRRWQLCLALSFLVSAIYVPAADAALSAEHKAGAIVAGVLADAADSPVAGSLELFAWPTGRPVEVGQTVHLVPVGHDRAAKDGRFSITGDLTPDLAELARLNGGYINFVLQAFAGGILEETHFSRYMGDTPFTAQEAGKSKRPVEWRASPEEAAEPLRFRLQEASAATTPAGERPIRPMQGGCSGLKLLGSEIAYTVIGELRAPHDTLDAFFTYGKRADSEIGVATRGSQGPWGLSGSFHIANSDDTHVTKWADSGEHLLVTTRFKYDKFEHTCPSGRREKVVASEWMGDAQAHATAIRGCAGAPEDRLGRFTAKTGFDRIREKAVQWEGAASVFGASLTARSGYSQWVQGHWRFGPADMHLLCGEDGPPKRAGHIFAGTSA
jgi:hypothetical protein